MNDIPTLFTQRDYDDWIASIVEDELDVILNEQFPELEPAELTYDDIRRSVEHSGNLMFTESALYNNYHNVERYSGAEWPGESEVDPQEIDLLAKAAELTRYSIIYDVTNRVHNRVEEMANSDGDSDRTKTAA